MSGLKNTYCSRMVDSSAPRSQRTARWEEHKQKARSEGTGMLIFKDRIKTAVTLLRY